MNAKSALEHQPNTSLTWLVRLFLGSSLILSSAVSAQESNETDSVPQLPEVVAAIEANLPDISSADLDRAALQGILTEFQSHLEIVPTQDQTSGEAPALAALTRYYQASIGYVAAPLFQAGAFAAVQQAYEGLNSENILHGLVLDLRHGSGTRYEELPKIAGMLTAKTTPLLDWGAGVAAAEPQSSPVEIPLVALIDETTQGAAEALAAIIRSARLGILVGRATAGEARQFKDIPLQSGQTLRLATGPIRLADGSELTAAGVKPDIEVLDEPGAVLNSSANSEESTASEPNSKEGPLPIPVDDAILVRAVDVLKGITLVEGRNRS